ncbi:predicted protein [Naegleria gruberi]|uniref:Predicted protein n=1 Tax=Naegleria gruberi TaxID=5762 RepID=D2VFC7_NAEGR|nr:uncharacterized protein NAEGRDRAFT_67580 [Naegleria gruberi]EFC44435.1 predicted protein [Naegleria gruberi]|eukprot:XP_002677179.1 predicted protein [Naegleria gruberi strain NEG-M]
MLPIQTLDVIHMENNDPNLISDIPPSIGNIRIKPYKSLLLPIPSESTTLYDTTRFTYYEVKLWPQQQLKNLFFGFGFTANTEHVKEDIVGWDEDTIGFRYDTGNVYQETRFTAYIANKVHLADVKGDEVFGFLLDHENGEFKVTRNGKLLENALGNRFTNEKYKSKIFKPMISSKCEQSFEMEINLGLDLVRKPFLYTDMMCLKQRMKLFGMGRNCSDVNIVCTK